MADKIRENSKIKLRQLKHAVMKKYQVRVSDNMCRRTKAKAVYDDIQSKSTHYTKIWDYGVEIERTNPGSTVKVNVQRIPSGETVFQRMYICFAALKEGWIDGCRKIIGLDGCFLKGIAQGELLSAVGRDANNQVYPIAWAVVDVETTDNWRWFISLLKADLGLGNGENLALISDQHKEILEAVRQVLPNSEHRQCARHVYANSSKKWVGVQFRGLFWGAAKSTYVQSFEGFLDKVKQINEEAYKDLSERRPYNWSRAYFSPGFDCDAVENGISECWNSMIKDTRGKPIIRMLEDIRLTVMARLISQRNEGERWTDDICPNTRLKLEEMKKKSRYWHVYPSGYKGFEVRCNFDSSWVNLLNKTCTCQAWQVNEIPCPHSVAAIYHLHKEVDPFVSDNLKKTKILASYMYSIKPVGGQSFWKKTNNPSPLPPIERRMPGRPSVKRKRYTTESGNALRSTRTRKCQKCRQFGHYKRTCKNQEVEAPAKEQLPKGRPNNPDPSRNAKKSTPRAANISTAPIRTGFRYGLRGGVSGGSRRGSRGVSTSAMNLVDVLIIEEPFNASASEHNMIDLKREG